MSALRDIVTIVAIVACLIGIAAHGVISAETVALFLVALIILVAVGRAWGICLVGTILRVGLPILTILALVFFYAGGDKRAIVALLSKFGELVVVLLGLYIMVWGVIRSFR